MVFYADFKKEDLEKYHFLAEMEFPPKDYCAPDYLLERWDFLKSFLLLDEKKNWLGWCSLSFKPHEYNPTGAHFLESVIFNGFKGKGYSKYLYKIKFDNSIGMFKSGCIDPKNKVAKIVAEKYGFKHTGKSQHWDLYTCDKNHYPLQLKEINDLEKLSG